MKNPKKILVIQQKMIGDVLASTVICFAVKHKFPTCELHYLIQSSAFPVVENHPDIDKVVFFDPPAGLGIPGLIAFGKKLKKENYDAVIDVYGKWESIIPAYFSKAPIRIGYKKWYTSFFYTKTVSPDKTVQGSAIYQRLQLAKALTGEMSTIHFPKIFLLESEVERAKADIEKTLDPSLPIIMISVLGSGENKSLPPEYMAQTLDIIARASNVQMLFNFMPNQKEEAQAIFALCNKETQEKIRLDFYIKGLRPFLAVLSQCDALIGNEGGAVNMAKALEIPTFTVFSPWINKSSWNMLADEGTHVAVHLSDYFPEIFGAEHPKKFKKDAMKLYSKLKPELFKERLETFVRKITS